jgi:hypothetical protein
VKYRESMSTRGAMSHGEGPLMPLYKGGGISFLQLAASRSRDSCEEAGRAGSLLAPLEAEVHIRGQDYGAIPKEACSCPNHDCELLPLLPFTEHVQTQDSFCGLSISSLGKVPLCLWKNPCFKLSFIY